MTVGARGAAGVADGGGAQVVTPGAEGAGGPADRGAGVAGRTGGPAFLRLTWRRRALR